MFCISKYCLKKNLTDYRKMPYEAAHQAKHDLKLKFLWTSQGRIKLRRDEKSEVIHVSSPSALKKLGFLCSVDPPKFVGSIIAVRNVFLYLTLVFVKDEFKKSYDLPLNLLQYRKENSAEYLYS